MEQDKRPKFDIYTGERIVYPDEEPKAEEPAVETPVVEEPTAEEPAVETPVVDEPKAEEPAVEAPVVDEPKAEEPAVEAPVVEEPTAEEPAVETPIVDEPTAEEPAVETPVVDEPKAEEPAVEAPVVEEPKAEESAVEAPVVEEPKAEEPAVETPVVDEPKAEEPAVEAPVVDEPTAEEPAVEAPVVDEPKAEESAAEEPVAPVAPQSGEYRYVPPYERRTYSPTDTQQFSTTGGAPAPAATPGRKKKKSGLTFTGGAVALLLAAAIILSVAAGFGGAICYEEFIKRADTEDVNVPDANVAGADDKEKEPDNDVKEPVKKTSYEVTGDEYTPETIVDMVASSVVEIEVKSQVQYGMYQYIVGGAGSGIVASEDGYIITNAHVIINQQTGDPATNILVRLNDGTEYDKAEVIGYDKDGDIALLKIDATGLNAVTFGNSDNISVGQDILLIGNPLGQLGGTVTKGIISATSREILIDSTRMNLIQIDAAANPGNSGGGLFNMKGELIGILNSGITNDDDGTSIDGIAFCIPVNDVVKIKDELEVHGYVTGKVFLGISTYDVTDVYTAYYYFRSQTTGVYITETVEGYNDKVLKYGDRVTAIGDSEVTVTSDITTYLQGCKVGDTIQFTVVREGKVLQVDVECFEYVPADKDTTDVSVKK